MIFLLCTKLNHPGSPTIFKYPPPTSFLVLILVVISYTFFNLVLFEIGVPLILVDLVRGLPLCRGLFGLVLVVAVVEVVRGGPGTLPIIADALSTLR